MKAVMGVLLLLHGGMVWAEGHPGTPADAGLGAEPYCGSLLTETECDAHRQRLGAMSDPAEVITYLDRHMAMLREREVMCGCTRERQILARARYR